MCMKTTGNTQYSAKQVINTLNGKRYSFSTFQCNQGTSLISQGGEVYPLNQVHTFPLIISSKY